MPFSWFDTKEVDALADWVIDDLIQRLPPSTIGRPDRKTMGRVQRLNDSISGRVRDFTRRERPNFYKRARLGSRIKWAMKEKGYDEEFIVAFTYELMTLVTVASRDPADG